jgi:hypothetical protein
LVALGEWVPIHHDISQRQCHDKNTTRFLG